MDITSGHQDNTLTFFVNGQNVEERFPDIKMTLLTYLRKVLYLTGTKEACGEGGCGSCSVIVSRYLPWDDSFRHSTVNSCLVPLCWVHGTHITTVEGLGNTTSKLHPIQKAIAEHHGVQCGYCTPGMVMSLCGIFCKDKTPEVVDIEDSLTGNLCRCTGYRPIHSAASTLIGTFQNGTDNLVDFQNIMEHLKTNFQAQEKVAFISNGNTWYQPTRLGDVLQFKTAHPNAYIAQGCTVFGFLHLGVNSNIEVVTTAYVKEFHMYEPSHNSIILGAGISIAQTIFVVEQYERLSCVGEALRKNFSSSQIRETSTLGGAIAIGGNGSDLVVALSALTCAIHMQSIGGERHVNIDENFLRSPNNFLQRGEVILKIKINFLDKKENFIMYKFVGRPGVCQVTKTLFTMAGVVVIDGYTIKDIRLAIGGVGKQVFMANQAKLLLIGMKTTEFGQKLIPSLKESFSVDCDVKSENNHGNVKYKIAVLSNQLIEQLSSLEIPPTEPAPPREEHLYQGQTATADNPIGKAIVHSSHYQCASGETIYIDDIPEKKGELHLAYVVSGRAHARIKSVDTTEALNVPGVVGYLNNKDMKEGTNALADTEVLYYGQPIGAVLATNREVAEHAAKRVYITYEDMAPIIVSLEQAVAAGSMFDWVKTEARGDVNEGLEKSDHVIEGEVKSGAQEHFYLETQSCIVTPIQGGGLEITVGTQCPSDFQLHVAKQLGLDFNKIHIKTKRMGGAFGGKYLTAFSFLGTVPSVAAIKYKRPVRVVLNRKTDMLMSGTRPSFMAKYKIGFDQSGKVKAAKVDWYTEGGCYMTYFPKSMTEAGMRLMDNCYSIPNFSVTGHLCKTNTAPPSGMRGYGIPEAHLVTETWLSDVAAYLGISDAQVREVNMYSEGDTTLIGDVVKDFTARRCWDDVILKSRYLERLAEITAYNKRNPSKKRGISIVPVRCSTGFGKNGRKLHQAAALVNIYRDGTVLISHHGVEMGQGLHTKLIQVASAVLSVPVWKIQVSDTCTDTLANGSVTSADSATDLHGNAVKLACEKLHKNILPIKEKNPGMKWEEIVQTAYNQRISLTESAYFRQGIEVDGKSVWDVDNDNYYPYYCYGAGVTEVEVDCNTGQHKVLQTDIVMDIGNSLNPGIDIGQIEGAFLQFYGLLTLEEHQYSAEGKLLTTSPESYLIPGIRNIPKIMNISLLQEAPNRSSQSVYSSKATGQPPSSLSISALLAIKMAIRAYRKDHKLSTVFRLDAPATMESIFLSCQCEISNTEC